MFTCREGTAACVDALLSHGGDPNLAEKVFPSSVLSVAVKFTVVSNSTDIRHCIFPVWEDFAVKKISLLSNGCLVPALISTTRIR